MDQNKDRLVLVTGATGFVSGHIIKVLLEADYHVRGTVRNISDKTKYEHLLSLPKSNSTTLQFVEADLLKPDTWEKATDGCRYVIHTASPFTIDNPKDEQVLIKPAVEGTLNVLRAALKTGVKKVVVTSSIAAIFAGHNRNYSSKTIFNEDIWSVPEKSPCYEKSKCLAEKAVWGFYEQNKDNIEIAVVNPGLIVGPFMSKNSFSSQQIILKFLKNQIPSSPKVSFPFVDVRDVAKAHLLALENPNTNGRRYLVAERTAWFADIANIMKKEYSQYGYKFPSGQIGKFLMTIASWFDSSLKTVLDSAEIFFRVDNSRSKNELGMGDYIPLEKSIIDMCNCIIDAGLVEDKRKKPSK